MEEVERTYKALDDLCTAIHEFQTTEIDDSRYRAPIIDHFHPEDYCQKGVAGLSRFYSHCRAERDYVEGILHSAHPTNEFTTNAPNLLAVWEEFYNAPRPLLLIAQMLDIDGHGQVKLDAIVDGGNEWIKVSTIREVRLLAEFREQDSYINSDYDSDTPSESSSRSRSPPRLTNSLITQARSLIRAAEAFRRPAGMPRPRIRFVLNRMTEGETYRDKRVYETFQVIRDMGVDLVLGKQPRVRDEVVRNWTRPIPTRNILLDLSVLVALCCDSAHQPLPSNTMELEARFRAYSTLADDAGSQGIEAQLTPHSNVTRDLRDQLQWEMQHSLIGEMQTQLQHTLERDGGEVQFWVTEEVRGRLPNIVDIIGGPQEKARAKALFREEGEDDDLWQNSRWKGKAPALGGIRIRILEDEGDILPDLSTLDLDLHQHETSSDIPSFNDRLVRACRNLLTLPESGTITPPAPLHRQKYRRSKKYKGTNAIVPTTRLPSQHTLNSFAAGAKRGWTVLTNNRGAVGKVIRDMGVKDGLPFDKEDNGRAVIWVVNPSSLSEWRRLEVEETNRRLQSSESGLETDPGKETGAEPSA